MADIESYRGDCPACGSEDVDITPSRLNPDREICSHCGANVHEPDRVVPANSVTIEYGAWDATPPVEDMQYDERQEREATTSDDAPGPRGRAHISKRMRRRQRRAAFAEASRQGRVVR